MAKKRANRNMRTPSPISPLPMEDNKSPKSTILNKTTLRSNNSHKKPTIRATALFQSSPPKATLYQRTANTSISSVSDLKDLASSRLDDLKRNLIDRSHSEILKDLEASLSRLHKRFKIQTQASQQVMDEADKEYKKLSAQISESQEAMEASYAEFVADSQATASRLLKTSIPELSKTFEKAVDALRSCYGIQST